MESNDLAQRYRSWRDRSLGVITEHLELAAVLELLGPLEGKRVLDAGCGDGMYALAASERGALVTGIDLSTDMLAVARARGAASGLVVDWTPADVRAIPFPDASFDVVMAITLLCLVPDPMSAVRELSRVLAPGGRLMIGDLHVRSLWAIERRIRGWAGNAFWRGAHFWTANEIRKLLIDANMRPGRVRGAVYYPPVDAIARLMAPVDAALSRFGTLGAAFLMVEGVKSM
jgi:ubiquinone/menaquinone biosynthesis C-methylase UbiE